MARICYSFKTEAGEVTILQDRDGYYASIPGDTRQAFSSPAAAALAVAQDSTLVFPDGRKASELNIPSMLAGWRKVAV